MVERPSTSLPDIAPPLLFMHSAALVGRQDVHRHPAFPADRAHHVPHRQPVRLTDIGHPGGGIGVQPFLEREIRRQLLQHVRHAAELIGDHRADLRQAPPGPLPHQMLTVARVDQAGHLVEPAAVAGEMPFDLGGGYPPLLPQQRAHIVKGIHGIGVMLLPAEHPYPADPAGLVGHIPVNAAQIGRRKPRELFGHTVHRPRHLLHGPGGDSIRITTECRSPSAAGTSRTWPIRPPSRLSSTGGSTT